MTSLPPYGPTPTPPVEPSPYPQTQGEPGGQPRMVRLPMPKTKPVVTYTILAITIFVFILQELNHAGILQNFFQGLAGAVFGSDALPTLLANGWGNDLLTLLGAKISPLITAGQYWRLVTPVLLHANLLHIGANMYSLFILGPGLERFYGKGRFLGLYLLSGIGGNLLSYLLSPGLSIGASTAIFGLLVAEGVFAYQNRALFGPQARRMLNNVVYLVILNLVIGFSVSSIDNWGHLGGLLVGAVFSWFAGPRIEVSYNYPNYELADQRSPVIVWLTGVVIFLFMAGLVYLRVIRLI